MKKWIALALVLVTLLSLCGCKEAVTSVLEKAIDKLSQQEVTLEMGDTLMKLKEDLMKLTEEEREKLKNLEILDKLIAKYEELEAAAIQKVEEQIAELPVVEQIQEENKDQIEAARKAWEKLPEGVREKIKNIDILEEAEKALEQLP